MPAKNMTNSLVLQIDQLLDEASILAKTERDAATFFKTLLQRAVLAVQAQSAANWMLGPDSHPVAMVQHQPLTLGKNASKVQLAIDKTVRDSIETAQSKKLIASTGKGESLSMFCCPYASKPREFDSAIAIYFEGDIASDLADVYVSFTEAIAEIAADYGSRNSSHNTNSAAKENEASEWNRFKLLSDALHENLDVRSTSISLVNLGRNFYSCDRVLLAQRSGSKFKVIAVSGAATVNRKSETVSAVESLVAKAFHRNEKPVLLTVADSIPAGLEKAFEKYQAVSQYKFLLLSPLPDQNDKVKLVQVIESTRPSDAGQILKRVRIAEPQTNSAFKNALQYQSIPLRGLLSTIGGSRAGSFAGRLFAPALFLALSGLAVAAMCLIQTDMTVSANGRIVPEIEKNIYAANEGVISKLHVEFGDRVRAGQLLIELSSSKMESDTSLLSGRIETEKKRLNAIEAVKSSIDRGSREGQRELGKLSSQEIESQQRIENLQNELAQLEKEKDKLGLVSPFDGIVVTRDAKTKLLNRPVDRGDALLRLIADSGKWLAKIRVPDSRIPHLLRRPSGKQADNDAVAIPVSLSIATRPEEKFAGSIEVISDTAELDEGTGQAFIVVTVAIESEEGATFQPGSSVVAEFNCGKTSVGYAWFNEFIDSVRYRFF